MTDKTVYDDVLKEMEKREISQATARELLEACKAMARCLKNGQLRFDGSWNAAITKAEREIKKP